MADLSVNVSDSSTTSESRTLAISPLFINVSDTAITAEDVRVPTVASGRLWSSGVEQQTLDHFGGITGFDSTGEFDVVKNATVSTAIFRGGLASARINLTTSNSTLGKQISPSATKLSGKVFIRGYLYLEALPTSISTGVAGNHSDITIIVPNDGSSAAAEVTIDASGVIRLYQDGTIRSVVGTSSALNTGQWYRIEMGYGNSAKYVELLIDGVSIGSTNAAAGMIGIYEVYYGCGLFSNESATVDMYWDDMAINFDGGVVQNSWPGAGQIVNLMPNATGDNNAFSGVGGAAGAANNYTRASSAPADDTTYNYDTIPGDIDDFNLTDTPASITSGDTINVVHVGIRGKVTTIGTGMTYLARIKKASSGTLSTSPVLTPVNSTRFIDNTGTSNQPTATFSWPLTLSTDPDGNAWTKSTLDSAQVGYMLESPASTCTFYVSDAWLVVDSTPGTASLSINASDTTVTSENSYAVPSDTNLNKSDTTITSEAISVALTPQINVSDTTVTSELLAVSPPLSEVPDDPTDVTKVDERLTIYLPLVNTKYIIVNDNAPTSDPVGITPIPPSYVGPFGPLKFSVKTSPYNFSIERFNPNDP